MSNTTAVTLQDVVIKRQAKTVLGPVSLSLATGGITVVMGPNGAGKTTLLRALHGVERLSSGTLAWAGARDAQAFIFQSPIMLRRSVRQNLAYPLQLIGQNKAQIAPQVLEWAERTGLTEALDRPAPRLSGGERQKLALARALIRQPAVLFLDEPCANLDGRATREIEALLQEACAAGTQIILITHDLGQARRLADEVLFMVQGKVVEQSAAEAFFTQPSSAAAQAFLQGEIVE